MRHTFRPALVASLPGLLAMQHAAAQVYQCLDASGKKVFSQKQSPPPASSDKQIIANCEANHGARCGSAGEIAQRRMEQRELTSAERQLQQNAVAARRYREQEESFNRPIRR
jgi:hypothetical protein